MRPGSPKYTAAQRKALQLAIHEANEALSKLWTGTGPKYFVGYLELNAQVPVAGELVTSSKDFLSASAEEPE